MFTYNITFITDRAREASLINYLSAEMLPKLINKEVHEPWRMKRVKQAGGAWLEREEETNLAVAFDFITLAEAETWYAEELCPALEDFHKKFGEQAPYFVTLLEDVEIYGV